jgi:hypothetical protein
VLVIRRPTRKHRRRWRTVSLLPAHAILIPESWASSKRCARSARELCNIRWLPEMSS